MHWLTEIKNKNGLTVNFFREKATIKNAETILNHSVKFYKDNRQTKWIFEDIEKADKIEIHFTNYETNESTKKLEISKADFIKLLEV